MILFTEDELIPISVLQHYSFCPRQVALIHLEQLWAENLFYAQALCLEEMFQVKIHEGQLYYLQEHRRSTVGFTDELKTNTKKIISNSMALLLSGETPLAHYEKKDVIGVPLLIYVCRRQ